jgi:thymidylate kinase
MKIGLAGIPGSGKTELAKILKNYFDSKNQNTLIIDDYVKDVEEHTNLALGFTAAYVGNIHVALERAARERKAMENNEYKNIITCGTMFETSSYAVQSLEVDYNFIHTDAERYDFAQRSEATMRILACFYIDLMKYDQVFYLNPLNASKDDKIINLERNLQSAFNAFNLVEYVSLPVNGKNNEEILNNRMKKVLETIDANNTKEQDVQPEKSN